MPGRRRRRPVSKAQARFFGVMAGKGKKWARNDLRGMKLKKLPARKRRKR
jgi:hypothetical protein